MNPYLTAQRAKFDTLRSDIEGLQTRAVAEKRDLTEVELADITAKGEQARGLATQITDLTEIETRNAAVAGLAANVAADVEREAVTETRSVATDEHRVGSTSTRDRDPGHYRKTGEHSFFGDMHRAKQGDQDAAQRLAEHNRALATGVAGAGVVAPHWLVEEYDALARQGRSLANAVRNVSLGNDPRPITLPKQATGADAVVLEQSAEGDAVSETDAWTSGVDTVVPKPTAGIQVVTRQMLDMGSPAVDQLIYGDLIAAYNLKVEKAVGAALVASAGTAVLAYATEAAFDAGTGGTPDEAVIDAAIAVRNARKLPADIVAMGVNRYGKFLKLKDDAGRPLMPQDSAGPMNVIGTGSVAVDGRLAGLGVIATDGIATGTYPESIVVLRSSDTILFESAMTQIRYEEVEGPEKVKLGIWAYTAVIVRQAGKSAKRVVVTIAA